MKKLFYFGTIKIMLKFRLNMPFNPVFIFAQMWGKCVGIALPMPTAVYFISWMGKHKLGVMEFLFLALKRPDVVNIMNPPPCYTPLRGCTYNCGVLVTERAKPLSLPTSRRFIKYTRHALWHRAKQAFVPSPDCKGATYSKTESLRERSAGKDV
jgi:hypothetical protein